MHQSAESAVFADLVGSTFTTEEERTRFQSEVERLVAYAELLNAFDEARAQADLSKAELARRIGVKPSVISRLLNGQAKNVELDTIAKLAGALDVYVEVKVRKQPKAKQSKHPALAIAA